MDPPSVPARVIKVLGKIGARGILTEVRLELLKFPRTQVLRAVKGPVRLGDIIRITDGEVNVWRR
ncbi:small ribosomal subunit protein eS28 [Drosophila nasuta]|uniref:Small ribosomal subunit protein eS28 n=1 Tax=Drosophila albomicans TaxID=7291 RepID=A0A6P8WFD4_DROAB|nr:40S ribosomal protein S28 [Drosophila albomicans]XP_060651120.1 small ribosomal subunit protein eS28 [Drosophila nasuta]